MDVASSSLVSRSTHHPRLASAVLLCALMTIGCATPTASPDANGSAAPSSSATAEASGEAKPSTDAEPSAEPTTPSPEPAPPTWTALDVARPQAREDHTWTLDGSGTTAYLFGGRDGAEVFGDLHVYDLATDTWMTPANAGELSPPARFGHEAVWVDEIGLVIFAGQAGTTFFNDLWAYDAGAWRQLESSGDVPRERYGSCAGIGPDGRLWISHGFTADQRRFADTKAYDFESGEWTDETPEVVGPIPRCLHGCWWTDEGALALYAGQTTGVTALDDLWLLTDGAWSPVAGSLPAARNLYARVRLDGATLVFGGQAADESYLADTFLIRDPGAVETLEPVGEAPTPRAGAEMVVDETGGRVLLFGGRDGDGAFNDMWQLGGVLPGP